MDLSSILRWALVVPQLTTVISHVVVSAEETGKSRAEKVADVMKAIEDSIDIILPGNKTAADIKRVMDIAGGLITTVVGMYNDVGIFTHAPQPVPVPLPVPEPPLPHDPTDAELIVKLQGQIKQLRADALTATDPELEQINNKIHNKTTRLAALGGHEI